MPRKKKTTANKPTRTFEQTLWHTADKLRGSVESSQYKHVVLSLIFLKFVSDKFEAHRAALIEAGHEAFVDMVAFYTQDNVFYLPEQARWSTIRQHAKQGDIALRIDTALHTIEKTNKALRGALPDNYFSRLGLDGSKLAALIDAIDSIDTTAQVGQTIQGQDDGAATDGVGTAGGDTDTTSNSSDDIIGRVYEYFLGKFAATEGKGGGEFYTPKCVVDLLTRMIEPYRGKIYDPCCGSGGMFVQSLKFIDSHQGNRKDVSIYGQEQISATYKLAKMNLAIRGISANLGEVPADTFFKDQHPDLKADFILANPPFNLKAWRTREQLVDDPRWAGFEVPPETNANYAWILHMVSKLSARGVAGFVLANGSMSTNTKGEGTIRRQLLEKDLVACMVALPGQLFYTTQIPVCLWFLAKDKGARPGEGGAGRQDRRKQVLFIDARAMGAMVDRTHKELTEAELAEIARTYHAWQSDVTEGEGAYVDRPGFCKSLRLDEIAAHEHVLTPGRYVGAAPLEEDGEPFDKKMKRLTDELGDQMARAGELDALIRKALGGLGHAL